MLFQRAFAKINLGLRVIRKRQDGYHDIETVFHRVNIFDDLVAGPAQDLSLSCDDPRIPIDGNLVLLAAGLLRQRFGVRAGARLTLTKRIPYGAGLGGGSADAAAALLLLCRLWKLAPPRGSLDEIALAIGSDVPYFLGAGSAYATSRGEMLSYFQLTLPYAILVIVPEIHLSTRSAFEAIVPVDHSGSDDLRTLLLQHLDRPDLLRNVLFNDFEAPAIRSHPQIGDLRRRIYDSGADCCLLSGSGSSVFGIYSDDAAAAAAASSLGGEFRTFLTPSGFVPDLRITGASVV